MWSVFPPNGFVLSVSVSVFPPISAAPWLSAHDPEGGIQSWLEDLRGREKPLLLRFAEGWPWEPLVTPSSGTDSVPIDWGRVWLPAFWGPHWGGDRGLFGQQAHKPVCIPENRTSGFLDMGEGWLEGEGQLEGGDLGLLIVPFHIAFLTVAIHASLIQGCFYGQSWDQAGVLCLLNLAKSHLPTLHLGLSLSCLWPSYPGSICNSTFRYLWLLCPLHLVGKCLSSSLYCGSSGFAVQVLWHVFNLSS